MLNIIYLLILVQSWAVIASKNSITAVINLIFVYLYFACFFILLGAEFLGLLLVIIYVGAISILFLFIIMMLNLRIVEIIRALFYMFR